MHVACALTQAEAGEPPALMPPERERRGSGAAESLMSMMLVTDTMESEQLTPQDDEEDR